MQVGLQPIQLPYAGRQYKVVNDGSMTVLLGDSRVSPTHNELELGAGETAILVHNVYVATAGAPGSIEIQEEPVPHVQEQSEEEIEALGFANIGFWEALTLNTNTEEGERKPEARLVKVNNGFKVELRGCIKVKAAHTVAAEGALATWAEHVFLPGKSYSSVATKKGTPQTALPIEFLTGGLSLHINNMGAELAAGSEVVLDNCGAHVK